jgi:hypothetical protein
LPASTNSIWNLTNTANTFSGNGGGLTNVNSTAINSGLLPARLTNTAGIFTVQGDANTGVQGLAIVFSDTNANSGSRNWSFQAGVTAYGDMGFQQSNAKGGNPVTAGTERVHFGSSGGVNIGASTDVAAGNLKVSQTITGNGFAVAGNAGWSGIVAGIITNAVGPHGVNFFIGGGIITNVTSF